MGCCRDRGVVAKLVAAGLTKEAKAISEITADEWKTLPKGWTGKSAKKFWDSLTGDRVHQISSCIKKMRGKVKDPGAFCGGLASRAGYR